MSSPSSSIQTETRDSLIACRNSQGIEIRASLLRLARYSVVFEIYNPYSILQLSEVLNDFRIFIADRMVYSGRAIVSNMVNTGLMVICECTLEESWLDVDIFAPFNEKGKLQEEFNKFLSGWERFNNVDLNFKIVVADLQNLLTELQRWLEQVELGIRSTPSGSKQEMEREIIETVRAPILPAVNSLFGRFEEIAKDIPEDHHPIHRSYIKRQIHPLVLCSPFAYRTYQKPLGYAGDYEMVNMMLRDPLEGSSLFAKTVNLWFLSQPPAAAHRNRINYLVRTLRKVCERSAHENRAARIFNLGCGPAVEIQRFLTDHELSNHAEFTLLDFNEETLEFARGILEGLKNQHRRQTRIKYQKRSVNQLLRAGMRPTEEMIHEHYDLVYCAGLFDYFSDRVCKHLMSIFYGLGAPGGLLLATNADPSNPSRQTMEYILEWHLIYRNADQLAALNPAPAHENQTEAIADNTGINIFIEVKKPFRGEEK